MRQTTQAFRNRYRADIHRFYNPWLHAGFVLVFGITAISLFWGTLEQVQPLEWLAVPLTLLLFNLVVYTVHRHLGHHKHAFARLFMPVTPAITTVFSPPGTWPTTPRATGG